MKLPGPAPVEDSSNAGFSSRPRLVRHWLALALMAAAGLLGASCGKRSDPDLLAKVGPHEIRLKDFQAQMARRGGARPETLDRAALLEEMIAQEALYVRALAAGLDQDPEVRRAWRHLLIGKLKERELNPLLEQSEITEAAVQAYYDQHQDQYPRPARMRLAVLTLNSKNQRGADALAALQLRMQEARQQALQAAATPAQPGFGALAIQYSEDQATRYRGGDIGWVEAGRPHSRLSEKVINAAFALTNNGGLSEVITDETGMHLVKRLDWQERAVKPLTEVADQIRHQLLLEQRRQIERAFLAQARQSVRVETYPDHLAAIPPPALARTNPAAAAPPALP